MYMRKSLGKTAYTYTLTFSLIRIFEKWLRPTVGSLFHSLIVFCACATRTFSIFLCLSVEHLSVERVRWLHQHQREVLDVVSMLLLVLCLQEA